MACILHQDSVFERDAVRRVVLPWPWEFHVGGPSPSHSARARQRPTPTKKCRTKTLKLFDDPEIEESAIKFRVEMDGLGEWNE